MLKFVSVNTILIYFLQYSKCITNVYVYVYQMYIIKNIIYKSGSVKPTYFWSKRVLSRVQKFQSV